MMTELILKELARHLYKLVVKSLKHTGIQVYTKEADLFNTIQQHNTIAASWCSEVNFADLKRAKSVEKVFVQLEFYVQPLRQRLTLFEKPEKIELAKLLELKRKHVVLLGQVGSGKTTSLKYLCHSLLFNVGVYESGYCYPLVIKLNEFNSLGRDNDFKKNILFDAIINILGIKFDFKGLDDKSIQYTKEMIVIEFLNNNDIIVFLDGFDELVFAARKQVVINEFEKLVTSVDRSTLIMTSRSSEFKYAFPNLSIFELCPLTDEQIETFANKWLELPEHAADFIAKIRKSPFYDTAIRPLTIAHLCAIYERSGSIPEKPKTVYKKIVMLLLEEWNQQRNIHRISKYAKFDTDRQFEFLSSLAFHLAQINISNSFSRTHLQKIYQKIHQDFDLDPHEMEPVINEIESHNGIILQSAFETFEFAHKSLQEYLTAEYLVRLPGIPESRTLLQKLPNEFAVAVAISSDPSTYFSDFVEKRIHHLNLGGTFIKSFVNRLLLEKVDFNRHQKVAAAALRLYSSYIHSIGADTRQLSMFYFDELIDEFEKLVQAAFKRTGKSQFIENYTLVEQFPSADGQTICRLQLKKSVSVDLPKHIFARASFIS